MNKGRRAELRKLKFRKRLRQLGLTQGEKRNYNCYRTTGKPCSCYMCSGEWKSKYRRKKYEVSD